MAVIRDASGPPATDISEDEYYDLGSFHRPVSASNDAAQIWFDRGLVWTYGFNHEEAVVCFEKAIAYDSNCVMAYWGVAYALGPNYNKSWNAFDENELETVVQRTHRVLDQAKNLSASASPVENALVHALQFRYPREDTDKDCSIWNKAYADAMEKVYQEFPDDLDVATLYADALMNLTPWQLWDLATGKPAARARTMDAKATLERGMAQEGGMRHLGLLHLYIHLFEMSSTPEVAKPAADGLRHLVPDVGHLNHMPAHLDVILGDYSLAVEANQRAIRVDEKFLKRSGALNFYTLYRMHDFHFCIYAAMFAGQSKIALETVAQLEVALPEELLRVQSPPMADWLEGFPAMRVHALVRFGRWKDIIDLQLPSDPELYSVTTAMVHYAKTVALAATGEIDLAEKQRDSFLQAKKAVPESRTLFNNKCVDILHVAEAMVDGELEYRRGNYDAAFANLREAIARDDGLPNDEPWGWMQPTRHAYGALLIEQGHFEQAAVVYAEDLGLNEKLPRVLRHPNNVWSLHGYHECMVRLGRTSEAAKIAPQLEEALKRADVPIKASCFCRLHVNED